VRHGRNADTQGGVAVGSVQNIELLQSFPVERLRKDLLEWWSFVQRKFPWRQTRDPYSVLIAEILLHRTRADQVAQLYQVLLERFPSVQALANSTPDELRELLYSAGLHWRWALLHAMAIDLASRFHGRIPQRREDLTILQR